MHWLVKRRRGEGRDRLFMQLQKTQKVDDIAFNIYKLKKQCSGSNCEVRGYGSSSTDLHTEENTLSWRVCSEVCQASEECTHWVFVRMNQECFLKGGEAQLLADPFSIVGVPGCTLGKICISSYSQVSPLFQLFVLSLQKKRKFCTRPRQASMTGRRG